MDKMIELYKQIIDRDYQRINVIDADTLELLYANEASTNYAVEKGAPYEGTKCYKYFYDREEQCENCPMKDGNGHKSFVVEREYDGKIDMIHSSVSKWKDKNVYIEYIEDITNKKNEENIKQNNLALVGALSNDYLNIFVVDPKEKTVKVVKLDGYVTEGFDREVGKSFDYSVMCNQYIKDRVYVHDIDMMKAVMDIQNVQNELRDKSVYVGQYRVNGAEKPEYYQYKYIRVPNSDKIVAGFINIDHMVTKEIAQANELKEKNEELIMSNSVRDRQYEILKSMSGVYYSMHFIDLRTNTNVEYIASEKLKPYANRTEDAISQMNLTMKNRAARKYVDSILAFVNLETVADRMAGKKMISQEFISVDNKWYRASFIAIDTSDEGRVESVIFVTQDIDEDKRREEELILNSHTDELTRIFNRRAYERATERFKQDGIPENMVLVSFDLNGLKQTNDTYGHAVGDELILGAVSCMKASFGSYGNLYRVGGDEFMAIITVHDDKLKEIIEDFDHTTNNWKSDRIDTLTISVGCVAVREFPSATFDELEEIADNRMYKSKALYYKSMSSRV